MGDDSEMFRARINAAATSAVGMPDGRVLISLRLDDQWCHFTATPGDCLKLIGDLSRGTAKAMQGVVAT